MELSASSAMSISLKSGGYGLPVVASLGKAFAKGTPPKRAELPIDPARLRMRPILSELEQALLKGS